MSQRLAKKLLLIGWDAADWKFMMPLLDSGLLPSLEGVINAGVMGNLATLQPILSPMLWTSIATGKRADQHEILGFVEPDPTTAQLRPVASTSRKVKAVWNILSQAGLRSNVVGWFASHPAEPIHGAIVSNQFPAINSLAEQQQSLSTGTVHPKRLTEKIESFRVRPEEMSAGHLLPFIPGAAKIDPKDSRLAVLATALAECASIHAAGTWLMEHEPWDFTTIYYNAIDRFGHHFMRFNPPKMQAVSEADYELYREVMVGIYRFHDMMLARLLELAGPETTVMIVSDHGFHHEHRRPGDGSTNDSAGPLAWHRPLGMICLKGPHIHQDERIYGASLLDITPTILNLFGLPVAQDMDGRPLRQAFKEPPQTEEIPTWEDVAGEAGMHPPQADGEPWDAPAAIARLAALGYIEAPGDDTQQAVEGVRREQKFTLAQVYLQSRRPREAKLLLVELLAAIPESTDYALSLAQCHLTLGELTDARRLIEGLLASDEGNARLHLLMGKLCLAEDRIDEALANMHIAAKGDDRLAGLHLEIGHVYARQKHWPEAEAAYRKALKTDGEDAYAHNGLAAVLIEQKQFEEAAEEALAAVGLLHHFPRAHFHLGVALARLGWGDRAKQAFETCLQMLPQMPAAQSWLEAIDRQANHPLRNQALKPKTDPFR